MAQKMADRIRYYGGMTSYIGGEGSFAEQALESFIFAHPLLEEENFEREGSDTLESLFDNVASGKYSFGCVPLMNNVSGTSKKLFHHIFQNFFSVSRSNSRSSWNSKLLPTFFVKLKTT